MITIKTVSDFADFTSICRDDSSLFGARDPYALPIVILDAAAGGVLTPDEAREALAGVHQRYPETEGACAAARIAIARREAAERLFAGDDDDDYADLASDAPVDDRDARIAALEANLATYSEFVEEVIAGEDGWDAELHVAMARHALAAIEEAGRARIAALEAENAVLRQRIAEMESRGGAA